jgi:protein-L-isoaspartate(D-aspartate) O-methyltransferase
MLSDPSFDNPRWRRERAAMVEHLRTHHQIRDERVLAAMAKVPRHLFVPEAIRGLAYGDHALPIAAGQTISQPAIVARQTELLAIAPGDRVLEIGAGSGYQTAVLAQLAAQVFALERIPQLAREADRRLRLLGLLNATVRCFDGTLGWSAFSPFRGILVAAGAPRIPDPLLDQLAVGGHLIIPVGPVGPDQQETPQRLLRVTRTVEGTQTTDFGPCQFVRLIGKFAWEQ